MTTRIAITKQINKPLLQEELAAEGILYKFIFNGSGIGVDAIDVDEQQAAAAQTVIDDHDHTQLTAEQQAEAGRAALEAADVAKQEAAKVGAKNIPGWALWTEQEALDWLAARLSDAQVDALNVPAAAKQLLKDQNTVLRALVRMVVALRDHSWPDLDRFTPE